MPKPGPGTTYKYTDKFKATTVKLSQLPQDASKDVDVAESLCIHSFMFSRWRKEMREGLIVSKRIEVDKETGA